MLDDETWEIVGSCFTELTKWDILAEFVILSAATSIEDTVLLRPLELVLAE